MNLDGIGAQYEQLLKRLNRRGALLTVAFWGDELEITISAPEENSDYYIKRCYNLDDIMPWYLEELERRGHVVFKYFKIESASDPRWNSKGKYENVGGLPAELETALVELKKKYGEPPPDIKWTF